MDEQAQPTIEESVTIAARAGEVWRAIVEANLRAAWWDYLALDANVGGSFEERWRDASGREAVTSGEVTDMVPERLLAMSWADDGWPAVTRVRIQLVETDGGTLVHLHHDGWGSWPAGVDLVEAHRAGWRQHLANLRAYVEQARA